jgi:predicted lipid-binding transport protein (Tim44 family)
MKSMVSRILAVFVAIVAAAAFAIPDAEARRLGGGKSFGKQQSNVTQQRSATPQQPAAAPQSPARQNAAPAAAGGSRWTAPIAGLAAGLGLAALASYLGFGEELASFMLIALMVLAAFVVFRLLTARRTVTGPRPAYQGSGYSPANVGQEAAVRYSPLPQGADSADLRQPVSAAPASSAHGEWNVPSGFDADAFVRTAKVQFVRLQAAFDAGDLNDLREFTSPEMFAELKLDIDERQGADNRTDVVTLDAELLGIETSDVEYLASVRFSGLIREQANGEAKPFDEVWNLSKPVRGSGGWVLAGIQQLG